MGTARSVATGVAVAVAVLDIFYGFFIGLGLAGGDGDPDSRLAAFCGRLTMATALVAALVAGRVGTDADPVAVAVMLLPAGFCYVGLIGTDAFRLRDLALALPFAVPPAILALAG